MGRRKMQPEEVEANRERIAKAAAELFAEHGFDAVSMRMIANKLGWSNMSAYMYYENKEAIFKAVREMSLVNLADAMEKAANQVEDTVEKIRQQSQAYVRFGTAHPHEYDLAFHLFDEEMPGFPIMSEHSLRSWNHQFELIKSACEEGGLQGDPSTISHLLWIGLHGLVTLGNARRLLFGMSVDDLSDLTIETALAPFYATSDPST